MVARGLTLTATALIIGLGLSAVPTGTMTNLLYGVRPTDGSTYAGVLVLFGAVALAACSWPAFRATRIDPMRVLRQE